MYIQTIKKNITWAMLAYRGKKSKYVRINFRKRPRFKIVQKLYRIYKNPQIVHSTTRLSILTFVVQRIF